MNHYIPYSGFCLICANYASCRELTILQLYTLALSFRLTTRVTVPCLWSWFLYPMSLFKYFKRGTLLLCCLTQKATERIAMSLWITCTTPLQYSFSSVANTPKHPCILVSSDHIDYTNEWLSLNRIQLHTPLHVMIL